MPDRRGFVNDLNAHTRPDPPFKERQAGGTVIRTRGVTVTSGPPQP
jgi:hypothetical protein